MNIFIYFNIHIQRKKEQKKEKDFFRGVGSHDSGDLEVAHSAVCKLETRERLGAGEPVPYLQA